MKVLLTGGAGFVGRHLTRTFLERGWELRLLVHRHSVPRRDAPGAEIVWGSMADPETVAAAVEGVDVVVHSGWLFTPPGTPTPTANDRAIENLMNACRGKSINRLLFLSSVAVYGTHDRGPVVLDENAPPATEAESGYTYPREKIRTEGRLEELAWPELALGMFRLGVVFDDRKGPAKSVIRLGERCLLIGLGSGRNHMPYIHGADLAEALALWIEKEGKSGVWNVTPSSTLTSRRWIRVWGLRRCRSHTILALPIFVARGLGLAVKMLKKALGKPSRADIGFAMASATRDLRYDNRKLAGELGWEDTVTREYTALDGSR